MMSNAIAAAATLALLSGGQSMPETQPTATTPQLKQATINPQQDQKNPYVNLVLTPPNITVRATQAPAQAFPTPPQWTVECGIKVMVVKPDLDPKMIVTPQAGAPEPKVRRISPPPCPERR